MSTSVEKANAADEANKYPGSTIRNRPLSERQLALQNYRARDYEIRIEFQNDLADEYAADLPKGVTVEIFRRAWDSGHSSGYGQVAQDYEELAEFARYARNAKED